MTWSIDSSGVPRRVAQAAGALVAVAGGCALIGWETGVRSLAAFSGKTHPMAPMSALVFILLGLALVLFSQGLPRTRGGLRAISLVVAAIALLHFFGELPGIPPALISWIPLPADQRFGPPPIGTMSRFTAVAFFSIATAFFLLTSPATARRQDDTAGAFAILTGSLGSAFAVGYLFNSPMFRFPSTLPMALNTSIAFILLSAGTLAAIRGREPSAGEDSSSKGGRLSVERNILAGFGLALTVVFVVSIEAFNITLQFAESGNVVAHTREVTVEIEAAISDLKDIESNSRGYIVGGNEQFLPPFRRAIASIDARLLHLTRLTAGNPFQRTQLALLDSLITDEMHDDEVAVMMRDAEGESPAIAYIVAQHDVAIMEEIREVAETMKEEESRLLVVRSENLQTALRETLLALSILVGLTIAFLSAIYLIVRHQLTSRRQTEREIEQTEHLLDSIVENIPVMVFLKDARTFRYTRVNKTAEELGGYSREDIVGRTDMELFPPEDSAFYREKDEEVVRLSGVVDVPEERLLGKTGISHIIHTRKIVLDDGKGSPRYILCVAEDVTEKKRLEEVQAKASREIEDLYNNAPCGYHSLDAEGRIVAMNNTELGWLGYAREEVIGHLKFVDVITVESLRTFDEVFPVFKERGFVHDLEFEFRRKDGSTFFVSLSSSAIKDSAGRYLMSRATIFDITARKKAETTVTSLNTALDARARLLETANKELEAFSYSVSHDLRAPLRHMNGFADLLTHHAAGKLDETSRRYLATISEAARHMGALIDDLLVFSRMGRIEMQAMSVDVADMVLEVVAGVVADLGERKIDWRIGALPPVNADPAMLRLVFENLLSNAVKYTRRQPEARIEIGSLHQNSESVYYVRDNGVGFDMQYSQKLFGVFQRLHSVEEFEGTGIGLANVRRIIHRHGGRTWAEGEAGIGATFFFSLPDDKRSIQ